MGHVWQGFAETQLQEWLDAAGLESFRYTALPPAPDAKGPTLFAASARAAGRTGTATQTVTTPTEELSHGHRSHQ
jgi:hypothetical protein